MLFHSIVQFGLQMKFRLLYFVIALTCFSCANKTAINSQDINGRQERIEKLKPEIKTHSEILDAEFDLFNVNGFNGDFTFLAGSSSSDYKFAVKVDPKDIAAWTNGLQETVGNLESEPWMASLTAYRSKIGKRFPNPFSSKGKTMRRSP